MRTAWHDTWGSGRGPVANLAPHMRLLAGALTFASCMVAPAASTLGSLFAVTTTVVWLAACRPPARTVRATAFLGLVLFLPYFLLLPWLLPATPPSPSAASTWWTALAIPWTVLLRGICGMLIAVATVACLSVSDLFVGLSQMRIPGVVALILLQIVQQTATLLYETKQIASAMAIRGAAGRGTAVWRVLSSLPQVWLPRVMARAERVAAAMELRGYCDRPMTQHYNTNEGPTLALALALRDVVVRYEPNSQPASDAVIDGVTLSVSAGEHVALAGLNGSGKTTLLLATVGLVPHEGSIYVDGVRLTRQTLSEARERVGFLFNVPEDQLLFPRVLDDVAFGLLRKGASRSEASAAALETLAALGIAHLATMPLHHLSHGQKQRVALAGALAVDPPLLLLDEPSAGLDPPAKHALAALLACQRSAMLVATHDLRFATRFCSRFILLENKKILLDDTGPDAILRGWGVTE
ncbi:MAG: ATP-binding cassette domain-containing protein [Pseudomonadota bacterium]